MSIDLRMKIKLRENLSLLLQRHGMTAAQLSKLTGVSKSSLSDWNAGRPPRSLEQLKKVCDALDVTVDEILFKSVTEESSKSPKLSNADALGALMGDEWISGKFEVKIKRLK
jgi:transcriptional regulator with XRE-family HTH domain